MRGQRKRSLLLHQRANHEDQKFENHRKSISVSWPLSVKQAAKITFAQLACSRLRDGGGKSFSNKKCEKRSPIFPAATAPFPKSCASYFRFARFNTFPLYYLRAWHRLLLSQNNSWVARDVTKNQTKKLSVLLSFYFREVLQYLNIFT